MIKPEDTVEDLIDKGRFRYRVLDEEVSGTDLLDLDADELSTMHPADLAERMDELQISEQIQLIRVLPVDHAAEVITELEEEEQHLLAKGLMPSRLSSILESMPPDEAADILGLMPQEKMEDILHQMQEESREETLELLSHPEDSAGGVMEKELVDFRPETTAQQALQSIRENFKSSDFLSYIYITNAENELVGVLSLKELILSKSDSTLGEIMSSDPVSVSTEEDQEKVAYLATKYSLQAIPVVSESNKLVGIVSADDITEIIEEEHKEDMYRMAGVHEDSGIYANPVRAAILRFPWLIATVAGGMIAAQIIESNKVVDHIWLLSFSPLILGLAGNVAIQTSTIIIRNLSTRQFSQPLSFRYLYKEAYTGIVLALLCGITLGVLVTILHGSMDKGVTLGVALFSVILISILSSILIPLSFNKFNIDPAIASGPLVTTVIDVAGLFIYFQCAYLILAHFFSP